MYRKNQGITMIVLVITIIVMMILVGVTITIGSNVINRSQLEDIKTNMLTIQGRLLTTKEKHDFDASVNLPGAETTNLPNGIPSGSYKLSQDDLNNMGLGNIKTDSTKYYIVNYNNDCEIYYSVGVKVGNNTYYSLTDLKDQ